MPSLQPPKSCAMSMKRATQVAKMVAMHGPLKLDRLSLRLIHQSSPNNTKPPGNNSDLHCAHSSPGWWQNDDTIIPSLWRDTCICIYLCSLPSKCFPKCLIHLCVDASLQCLPWTLHHTLPSFLLSDFLSLKHEMYIGLYLAFIGELSTIARESRLMGPFLRSERPDPKNQYFFRSSVMKTVLQGISPSTLEDPKRIMTTLKR